LVGGRPANLDSVFVDYVLVSLGVALLIVDVPPQGLEQGIDKLQAYRGLVVAAGAVGIQVAVKPLDQFKDSFRGRPWRLICLTC